MNHHSHTKQRVTVPSNHYRYPGETDNHFRQRCRRAYDDCAEAYHLFQFTWQIFGHVTSAHDQISHHKILSMLFAALRCTFVAQGLQFDNAVWVRCEEMGKLGRAAPHIHFLIAAIPKRIDLEKFCHTLKSKWHRVGGGLHKITPYDRGLDGAGYMAKRAGEFNGYSRETFGLMFSPAALARLRRMAERGTV